MLVSVLLRNGFDIRSKSMKTKLMMLMVGLAFASCSTRNVSDNQNLIKLSGKIEKLEVSGFGYGSHLINSGGKMFALTSKSIDLNKFAGKAVVAKGKKIDGYPLEGGPDYIEILEVNSK